MQLNLSQIQEYLNAGTPVVLIPISTEKKVSEVSESPQVSEVSESSQVSEVSEVSQNYLKLGLHKKQIQVMNYLRSDYPLQTIARKMNINLAQVYRHLSNIRKKVNCKNNSELRKIAQTVSVKSEKEKSILTKREREIMSLTQNGLSAKQIANRLNIQQRYVYIVQHIIRKKLNLTPEQFKSQCSVTVS